ncbi:MAG: hypothetical protein ABII12_09435 [Planctomycetota bacterium]
MKTMRATIKQMWITCALMAMMAGLFLATTGCLPAPAENHAGCSPWYPCEWGW